MLTAEEKTIELVGTIRELYDAIGQVSVAVGFDYETRFGRACESVVNLAINQFAREFGLSDNDIDVLYDFILSGNTSGIAIKTPNGHTISTINDLVNWVRSPLD